MGSGEFIGKRIPLVYLRMEEMYILIQSILDDWVATFCRDSAAPQPTGQRLLGLQSTFG